MSSMEKNELFQAVVITDDFTDKFEPLTRDGPKCLLPIANRPILSYTLEFLKLSGIQEVYLYVTHFSQEISAFIKSQYPAELAHLRSMNVIIIVNEECHSLGEAMRDLDGKGLLRSDFVLMHGDTISNADLMPLILEHKERAKTIDRNASMTLVFKRTPPGSVNRTSDQELLLALEEKTNKVLHFKRIRNNKITIPMEIFEEYSDIDLRYDFQDPSIAICSHAIPPLFSDNFDCQDFDEFVRGVIENDLIENTIYCTDIEKAYAARVYNFSNYQSVSQDVLNRWLYPIVPDSFMDVSDPYQLHRRNVYKGQNVTCLRGSIVEKNVILGKNSSIGKNCKIKNSSFGANVKIGDNVFINNSIIHDNVSIKDGSQLDTCIVATNVTIEANVKIQDKSVLGRNVVVPEGVELPQRTKLVSETDENEDHGRFGAKALVFKTESQEADEDEKEGGDDDFWGYVKDIESDSSSSDESDLDDIEPDIDIDEDAKLSVFHGEIFDSLQRGAKEQVDAKNLVVEINSSRYAYNATQTNVIHSVITSLMTIACSNDTSLKGSQLFKEIQKILKQFSPVLLIYCKSEMGQLDCLSGFEDFCSKNEVVLPIAKNVVHSLYQQEILSEEAILKWYNSPDPDAESESKTPEFCDSFRKYLKSFIDWLQESSEEESDD